MSFFQQLNCNSSNDPSSNSVGGIGSLNLPQWTADEQADRHFWYDTSASGEACHVGDFECLVRRLHFLILHWDELNYRIPALI
uniref:Glycoside hydrolase n=1 Tax=Mesocestoides corti TaxID=53468 RepID=A0A5K3FKT1_MESCO